MESTEGEAVKQEWIVVCVGCLRTKRNDKWTDDRTTHVVGQSSGFCDRCSREQRKRQSMSASVALLVAGFHGGRHA